MFDPKIVIIILAVSLLIFGTKRLRTIGSDLGAALKGFKQAMNEAETEPPVQQVTQDSGATPHLQSSISERDQAASKRV